MAKSHQTFNKREVEKKKEQKRKEKDQRREERKANPKSSMDDMIAYVDENGNISSTPPDPMKKRAIKTEDIIIGVARQEAVVPDTSMKKGKVTFFNDSKGYGFIRNLESQESVFVHINSLDEAIKENDEVSFQTEMGMKGPVAVNVTVTKSA